MTIASSYKPGAAQAPGVSQPKTAGQEGVAQTSKSPNLRTAPTVARDETKSGAPAALSAEQHAKIWTTLRGEKTERLTNVPFSITVGEIVPGTVHLYSLPVSILEYAPQYRDYEYILVQYCPVNLRGLGQKANSGGAFRVT